MLESLPPEEARRNAVHAVWTFPAILGSSFVVAWGAEAAQFYVSQGLALALLAWIQVLPEFAVEAVIAWHRDIALMTANFTGALRLLTGLGWPVIWLVFAIARRARGEPGFWAAIDLDDEHSIEIVGLVPALGYFGWIIGKGSLELVDSAVLLAIYVAYLVVLNRVPAREAEHFEDLGVVPRAIMNLPGRRRSLTIVAMFLGGAMLLYLTVGPFLTSMVGIATTIGISQFVFVQWVAPFLSEFPEFVSTSNWARSRGKAGMALMNMASSNINQWTVLAAMIPIAYCLSLGRVAAIPMVEHRGELILTLLQSVLGVLLLANLRFHAFEALGLFLLWFVQFLMPGWRSQVTWVYAAWIALELIIAVFRPGRLRAFQVFPRVLRGATPDMD